MKVLKKAKRNFLKISFLSFIFLISFLIWVPKLISAFTFDLEVIWPPSPFGTSLTKDSGLTDLVRYFYDWILFLGGIATLIALIMGGFKWMTSTGNPSALADAKDMITSALIGLALLLGSWLILHSINPELVILSAPTLTPTTKVIEAIPTSTLNLAPCAKAIIYEQTNYGGNSVSINVGGQKKFNFQPKSVKIVDSGGTPCENASPPCGCIVNFYSTSTGGNCSGSIQYTAGPQSTPDLTKLSLPVLRCAEVKSAKLF